MTNLLAFCASLLTGWRLRHTNPAPVGQDVTAPRHGRTCARLAAPLPPVRVRRVPTDWIVVLPSRGWQRKQEEATR